MLQIRLIKNPSLEAGVGAKLLPADSVTVACPDHLVLADLPVAKGLGSAIAASIVKTVGRRSRRQLGDRVHFCVRCDFPIAIYGRLSPCEHAFCLDCARSDSMCYLCDERIQKIQTIKMMEGIFICAAPHCLKSFLKKAEFESHIRQTHTDLLHPKTEKDGNESDTKKPTASDSAGQVASRPVFSPNSSFQNQDREERAQRPQHRDQPTPWPIVQSKPPFSGLIHNHPLDLQPDNRPQGFDKTGHHSHFPSQSSESQGGPAPQQESNQFPERQQGILSEMPFPEYPMHPHQPPNYILPMNSNPLLASPSFNFPPYGPDGAQPFISSPYEMPRSDSVIEGGSAQVSLLGFRPGVTNLSENYPRPWNNGPGGVPYESSAASQRIDGFSGMSDPQARAALFQADYGRNTGVLPLNLPLPPAVNAVDSTEGKGMLVSQPVHLLPLPPPPPPLTVPHMSQRKQGAFFSSEMVGHEGQTYRWQPDKHDSYGSGQE